MGGGAGTGVVILTDKVKWFDAVKGFGFIEREDQQDVFVHYSEIVGNGYRSLNDGEEVDYELVETERGPQAHNVRRTQKEVISC